MPKVSFPVAVLAASLLFVVLFWRLGTPTFWDPDEAHYAQTSVEMLATGDWWSPYYNETPFFDKPVLFHQLQALAMRLLADPELAARIVPALAGVVLIVITVWFGTVMLTAEVGIVAGLVLAASPAVFGLARYAILDMLFTMFMFGAAACLAVAALRDRPRLQWLGYVSLALAVWTKGPLALVICGLTLLAAIGASAELRRRLLGLRWALGLVFVLALSAPPFLSLYLRFGQDFVNGYILDENFKLFAASRYANQPGYSFYFRILLLVMLPWTGLLVGRLVDDLRILMRRQRLDPLETLLWAWPLTITGFFTLSAFKLDHYVFPALPALSLLCARAWSDVRTHRHEPRLAAARAGYRLIGPLMMLLGFVCAYFLAVPVALPRGAAIVPAALTLGGAILTIGDLRGAAAPRAGWPVVAAMAVTYAGIIAFVLPEFERRKVVPDVARWVAGRAQPADRVASYRLNRWNPAYRFYVGRHISFLEDPLEAAAFFGTPGRYYCVMRSDGYDELVAKGAPIQIVYEREGMPATSGRMLWRTRTPPLARFVVVTGAQ